MMCHSCQKLELQGDNHSAEAICLELPQQSYHQCDQSSIPSCSDGVFSHERPSVKMKLDNIWNNKLQVQGECTSTCDGESKEEFATTKTQSFLYSGTKWRDFRPEITLEAVLEQRILRIGMLYTMSLLAPCILLVIHWFLIPQIKTGWRVPKFSNSVLQMSEFVWKNCARRVGSATFILKHQDHLSGKLRIFV
ncbi:uncharacterized protein LOC129872366 [Solanum dulcamara]|uniref:uncharacterized protein LOC129872366 n=1 Tax=Solanum dulcamara TaxID=45834 RepID=UPI0024861D46|nr:uncharacterized protein LOC129872366 [Solanum dulcamara]